MALKWKALVPVATTFIAFLLTLLCLFAGTKKGLLNNADIMTLYTPEGSSQGQSSPAHSFYSVHVMSYCQGTLGTVQLGAPDVTRNVTSCSRRSIPFSFDPTQEWPKEITQGPALEWPRVISDDFQAFRLTSRAMAVLYCIGVGAMGAALLVRAWQNLAPRAHQGLFEFGFMGLGTTSVSIASIIATVIAFEFVALINAHGRGSNVSAQYGGKFLGMTWAAAGLLLVGSVSSFMNVFVHGGQLLAAPKKDAEGG